MTVSYVHNAIIGVYFQSKIEEVIRDTILVYKLYKEQNFFTSNLNISSERTLLPTIVYKIESFKHHLLLYERKSFIYGAHNFTYWK